MSLTSSLTMAEVKPDHPQGAPFWHRYSAEPHIIKSSHPAPYESNYPPAPLSIPHHPQSQRPAYRPLEIPALQTRSPLREGTGGGFTTLPPNLNTHHSYPNLKRGYHNRDDSPFAESAHDTGDGLQDARKPGVNQDNRILCFNKLPDQNSIGDQHGRAQPIGLTAQIHGMFFLSEMTTQSEEGLVVQPELTCYRRNLFQISGSVHLPRVPLSLLSDRSPIRALEVMITATESIDKHPVKLIVIPWKTPPQNSPELGPGQEHEPSPIPLAPMDVRNNDDSGNSIVFPIAYRRLQFRIATANNGRRRELQQHFVLHLNVTAILANGSRVDVCETSTAPIVVRGRSPRNFEARKVIPLVGSSAARGHGPELQTGVSSAPNSATTSKPKMARPGEPPRSAFNFDSSHLPQSPLLMRQSTYPTWNQPHQQSSQHNTTPSTPSYPPPALGSESFLQVNHSSSEIQHSHSPVTTMPAPAPPIRTQYAYHSPTGPSPTVTPVRYLDDNPRPAKSPRHIVPPDIPLNAPYPEISSRFASSYSTGANEPMQQTREYFPVNLPSHTLPPATEHQGYARTVVPSNNVHGHHYDYTHNSGGYSREGQHHPQPSAPSNYSWSAT